MGEAPEATGVGHAVRRTQVKYRVVWRHDGNETVMKGPEVYTSQNSAEKVAKEMNRLSIEASNVPTPQGAVPD